MEINNRKYYRELGQLWWKLGIWWIRTLRRKIRLKSL